MVMRSFASILAALLVFCSFASAARADCNPKDFMVQDVMSIQQSGDTELAFVLTASQSEYETAKKSMAGSGTYGLFSAALNYNQARDRAFQISQATKFDYKNSYASNYLSQTLNGKALDLYVQCLEKDKEKPGLALWFQSRDGDYFTFRAFWVGNDAGQGTAQYDAAPFVDGGAIISKPVSWIKAKTEDIVVKRTGNNDFYLRLSVGGQTKAKAIVKDPPVVVWNKQVITSTKALYAAPADRNPGCGFGTASDTIYPVHPGGYFVAGTRTTNHSTTSGDKYGETFTVDRPDQISVTITQSTGACEMHQEAKGQLQAVETFPVPGE
jgi:hypothetical protein